MSTSIKRKRRTKEEMNLLYGHLYLILDEYHPQAVRGVYYRMVARKVIEKSQIEYKNVVVRLLGIMRESGIIPFEWIVDNTRWMRKPDSFESVEDALIQAHKYYRRSVWHEQPVYVEIWIEADSLAGVLYDITEKWDVPLMASRGFSSKTFLYESAQAIRAKGKPTYIYHLGDYDESGQLIADDIKRKLKRYGADVNFETIAITKEQVEREIEGLKDLAIRKAGRDVVELEAIPVQILRELVEDCITRHMSHETLEGVLMVERAERETLKNMIHGDFWLS